MTNSCRVSKLCVLSVILACASIATIVTLWTIALTGGNGGEETAPWNRHRLPANLLPESYNVTLWPRLLRQPLTGLYIFTGNSTVTFACVTDTDLLLIHSNKLNYTQLEDTHLARISRSDGGSVPIKSSWLQPQTQYLVLQLDTSLRAGQTYRLYTEFTGELADDLVGFYRTEYEEHGVQKIVAASQMHPTHARKTFPCFDEPALKAVFYITLIHPPGTVALSNGLKQEVVDATLDGHAVTVTSFEPTEIMSTYLLALIVSDFANISSRQGDTLIRIWARRTAIDQGQGDYALNVTGPILDFFQQETKLLYDPESSSIRNKEATATIIAHELAHMWFGNLVTLRWWNEVWLNEGFASYVAHLGMDHAEPAWNVKDVLLLSDLQRVLALDALTSSHPLSSDESSIVLPQQISEQFDAISYSKVGPGRPRPPQGARRTDPLGVWLPQGAAVLRMLSDVLSEAVFVQGLSSYLKDFAYRNTVGADLWRHLQMAVTANNVSLPRRVNDIMNRWVLQMGFPVVTIDTATGRVSQDHFLLDPGSEVTLGSPYRAERGDEEQRRVLGPGQPQRDWILPRQLRPAELGAPVSPAWFGPPDVSPGETAPYFVQLVPLLNRAQLLDDALSLARAKRIPTTLALRTTSYLSMETEYMPWQSALDGLQYYFLMLDRTEVFPPMQVLPPGSPSSTSTFVHAGLPPQDYVQKLVKPLFLHFKTITADWTAVPERLTDQYNQENAVRVACQSGLSECQNLTSTWFRQWMDEPQHNRIHQNLRLAVYCAAIAAGDAAEWEFAWSQLQEATVANEASALMSALACTGQAHLLQRYLSSTLNASLIRKQDASLVIAAVASNRLGHGLAWDFVREHWEYMFTEYGVGSFSFSSIIRATTARFSSPAELQQLEEFVARHGGAAGFGSAALAVEQALERTSTNMEWLQDHRQELYHWFQSQSA
uniref:Aminopeptidase n=1 Tax=Tetraodon nigroviridis TaxID=99883 RepID=H3CNZ6_TETNG